MTDSVVKLKPRSEPIACEDCGCNEWEIYGYVREGLVKLDEMICLQCGCVVGAEIEP